MDVVGQLTVHPQFHRAGSTPRSHPGDVCQRVFGADDRLPPPDPPLGDVVGPPRRHDPRESRQYESVFLHLIQIKN